MNCLKLCETCGKTVFEEEVITIGLDEYRKLKSNSTVQFNEEKFYVKLRRLTRSPIVKNTLMAKFILSHFHANSIPEIVELCKKEFGIEAPSASAVDRFLRLVKKNFKAHLSPI